MATKTITIMEDAYKLLKQEKQGNESFSDVIRRNIKKKKSLWDFVGLLSEENGEGMNNFINEQREKNSIFREKRIKELAGRM